MKNQFNTLSVIFKNLGFVFSDPYNAVLILPMFIIEIQFQKDSFYYSLSTKGGSALQSESFEIEEYSGAYITEFIRELINEFK